MHLLTHYPRIFRAWPVGLALLLAGPARAQVPALTSRTPVPNTHAAPAAGPVTATFSQPLNPATVGGVRVQGSLRQGRRAGTASVSGNTLSFQPAVPFLPGEAVSVSLPASVQGAGGAGIAPQVYEFRAATGGTGRGQFSAGPVVPLSATTSQYVDTKLADLDNDGDLDMVHQVSSISVPGPLPYVSISLQQGGTFTAGQTMPPLYTTYTNLLDVEGDGDLDLVQVSDYGDSVSVALNNGSGRFSRANSQGIALPHSALAMVTGDVDGDGDGDLVLQLLVGAGLRWHTVWFNDGSGHFSAGPDMVITGSSHYTFALGDMDEDGDLDLLSDIVHSDPTPDELQVSINQGSGTFAAPVTIGTCPFIFNLTVLDVTNDRHLDIVVTGAGSGGATVFAGTGNGTLGPGVATTAINPGAVFGDLDTDGDLDCVSAAGYPNNQVAVSLNDGSGGYTPQPPLPLPATSFSLALLLGDLDGDADLDLGLLNEDSVNPASTRSLLLFHNYNGMPAPAITGLAPAAGPAGSSFTITGSNLAAASAVSLNGTPAVVTANTATSITATVPAGSLSGPVTVTTLYGSGSSALPFTVQVLATAVSPAPAAASVPAATPISIAFTEPISAATAGSIQVSGSVLGSRVSAVTGGGTAQLAASFTPGPAPGEVLTVLAPATLQNAGGQAATPRAWSYRAATGGTGTGNFQPGSTISSSNNGPSKVLAADLNHDGRPDLLALQPDAPNENVLVSLNAGTSTGAMLAATLVPVAPNSRALAVADINGDGHPDLLTSSRNSSSQGLLSLRLGNGAGGFGAATDRLAGTTPQALAVGDVNNDGRPDVVVADYTNGQVLTYLSQGGGLSSAASYTVPVDAGPTDVALADLNNDGYLDVLAAAFFSSAGRVSVRLGNGSGQFGGSGAAVVNPNTSALAVGDLNGDGRPDLVSLVNSTGGASSNAVMLSLGTGDGSFAAGQNYPLTGQPIQAALGDIDADGDLDVVVANYGAGQVSILRNDGGSLTLRPNASAGPSPNGVTLADLDTDGDLDLGVANYGGAALTVRLNTPGPPPPPAITGFSPGSGGAGTTVTVSGTGFTGATEVTVNGQPGFVLTVVSATQLTFVVPFGASSGPIAVTTPGGTATSTGSFTVLPAPGVSGFTPASGPVGTVVTFTGSNFTGVSDVNFNGTPALAFTVDSDTQVRATVPAGASTGFVILTGPGGSNAAPPPFVVTGVAPTISFFSPDTGPAGTVVEVSGSGFTGATAVSFNGVNAAVFSVQGDGLLQATVPAGASTGPLRVTTPSGQGSGPYNFTVNTPANDLCAAPGVPVLACGATLAGTTVGAGSTGDPTTGGSGLTPSAAAGGVFYQLAGNGAAVTVSLCGSTFAPWGARLFVYSGSCGALSFVAADASSCPNSYPQVSFLALTGSTYYIYVSAAGSSQGQFLISARCDLVVSTAGTIPAGTYQSLTITGQGLGTLGGPVVVQSQLQVQAGGTLLTNCQPLSGPGSFSLGSGATLGICDANGLGLPGSGLGAVQLTGPRTLSPAARYLFNGSVAQVSGPGLPAQVQALTLQNPAGLALSGPLSLSQLLRLTSGDLSLSGQTLTLLSGAGGTALIDNAGGTVLGATGRMQRWLDPSANPGLGYRHFSAPVSGCRVQDLISPGYAPVVNPAYNTSPNPGSVVPFPTFLGYDETRLGTSPAASYSDFDKGWVSPASLTGLLTPGRGYTANLPASALSSFTGTFNNGPLSLALSRGPQAEAGWQLLGNPYPAPIDWDAPGGISRSNVDNALYVFQSSGPYAGQYRAYVNGVGPAGANLLAAGQGFFVRVSDGQTSGSLGFSNAARLTDFAAGQPALARQGPDRRPQLVLRLAGSTGPAGADETYLYFEAGATPGFDAAFDARKLPNPGSIGLATELGGVPYAVNGLPAGGSPVIVPLVLQVPRPGAYTFTATQLRNFGAGQTVVLRDALLNTRTTLSAGSTYSFALAATTAPGRFWLELAPAGVLAAGAGRAAAALQVFPNPSHTGKLRVLLPLAAPLAAAAPCAAELRNALGQLVRVLPLRRPTQLLFDEELDVSGLAPGVYQLQLTIGTQQFARRVVLD